jgi:release factor glutamine methyltransferase
MTMNVKEALQRASFCLREKGLPQPRREAESLLTAALGVSLAWLYAHDDAVPDKMNLDTFFQWVNRRAAGEPYAYLAGEKEFMGLMFDVNPAVLIPRPETELLVEAVAAFFTSSQSPRLLDVGAGSGAVAVSLAVLLPAARVTAVDISQAALSVAAANARRHAVTERVRLLHGDLYGPVLGETFDAVISNPPYIPAAEIAALQNDVKDFEPRLALDGGDDGLLFYRRLTGELDALAARPSLLAFELGMGQFPAVQMLCQKAGYTQTRRLHDLARIPRVILAQHET